MPWGKIAAYWLNKAIIKRNRRTKPTRRWCYLRAFDKRVQTHPHSKKNKQKKNNFYLCFEVEDAHVCQTPWCMFCVWSPPETSIPIQRSRHHVLKWPTPSLGACVSLAQLLVSLWCRRIDKRVCSAATESVHQWGSETSRLSLFFFLWFASSSY